MSVITMWHNSFAETTSCIAGICSSDLYTGLACVESFLSIVYMISGSYFCFVAVALWKTAGFSGRTWKNLFSERL